MTPPADEFEIVLRAIADKVPPVIRLRRFLKNALRCYRLRCVKIRPIVKPAQKEFFNVKHARD